MANFTINFENNKSLLDHIDNYLISLGAALSFASYKCEYEQFDQTLYVYDPTSHKLLFQFNYCDPDSNAYYDDPNSNAKYKYILTFHYDGYFEGDEICDGDSWTYDTIDEILNEIDEFPIAWDAYEKIINRLVK